MEHAEYQDPTKPIAGQLNIWGEVAENDMPAPDEHEMFPAPEENDDDSVVIMTKDGGERIESASLKGGLAFGTSIHTYDHNPENMVGGDKPKGLSEELFGEDLFGGSLEEEPANKLNEEFIVPPFSVFNTQQGYWQNRKRAWTGLGIKSELGRGEVMLNGDGGVYAGKSEWSEYRGPARVFGGDLMRGERTVGETKEDYLKRYDNAGGLTFDGRIAAFDAYREAEGKRNQNDDIEAYGTSIFDPVVCELMYSWFCPIGGSILDPFAGGSVRGIVAAKLGLRYTGIDLSPRQVAANEKQRSDIVHSDDNPRWIVGDSRTMDELLGDEQFDFIFSCPPYGDLEVYSDDERDLSTMDYGAFLLAYGEIIDKAIQRLKTNRFACFVVSEIRYQDVDGAYRGFTKSTVDAFERSGDVKFYNEIVLINAIGSLPLRVTRHFISTRKVGRCHQYILVFLKGDAREAAKLCRRESETVWARGSDGN